MKHTMNRKEFLHKVYRYGIIGILGVLTGFLLLKRKVTIAGECTENFACKNCNKYSKCTLPEKS